ncbi:peroxisomal membrane protein PEX16 [Schistocerca cancellata]|uniref:peroxisomal membrane protein PEX16 n=1 Tax=Schistocerca cancellata TaxID=274614 RepID=UPI0021198C23|nr:peroxisomal membrane protein PEX16 [Schistocerca cancellata]
MTTIARQFSELYESYRQWVCNNPQVAGDVESTVKWVSYFVAGRISHSSVLSELIYSVSNLLVLFNDRIIHNSTCKIKGGPADRLKIWLTVIEYSEVFIEVAARRRWGSRGKWTVAVILQLLKCAAKLHLLFNYKEHVIQNPPVPPVRRKTIEEEKIRKEEKWKLESMSFALKRSGRLIRKVQGAPPIHLRDWKPLKSVPENGIYEQNSHSIREVLKKETVIAEVVYIVKPLMHLYAMWRHGPKSWKPWLISLLVDVVSLFAYRKTVHKLTRQQRMEVSRRAFALVLYILRSPFYEAHSRDRIQSFLHAMSETVPLTGILCRPLAQYLPVWQDTYFYVWSS